jgi:hypothetical protein
MGLCNREDKFMWSLDKKNDSSQDFSHEVELISSSATSDVLVDPSVWGLPGLPSCHGKKIA